MIWIVTRYENRVYQKRVYQKRWRRLSKVYDLLDIAPKVEGVANALDVFAIFSICRIFRPGTATGILAVSAP
jgi:hypothetical protein